MLYPFRVLSGWTHGFPWVCGWCCCMTTLVTCSLLSGGRVWGAISPYGMGGRSWSVSATNENPSLITRDGGVIGPSSRHVQRTYLTGYSWRRFPPRFKESWRVTWNLVLNASCRAVMPGDVPSMKAIEAWHSGETGGTWGLVDDAEAAEPTSIVATSLLDCFFCERLHLFLSKWM